MKKEEFKINGFEKDELITPSIIFALWRIIVWGSLLSMIGSILSHFFEFTFFGMRVSLPFSTLVFFIFYILLGLLIIRIWFELIIVIFRFFRNNS